MDAREKKLTLTRRVKYLLDFMFYSGIVLTLSLPFSLRFGSRFYEPWAEHYWPAVVIYMILGVAACILLNELRRIFMTVLSEDCFVNENVASLRKMGNVSFFIVLMSIVRFAVYMTTAILVVILVFTIAGLFSKVLALVFEEAVRYKEENDLTI